MAESDNDNSWMDQFLQNKEEESIKPDDQRRLEELERMQKQASSGSFAGMSGNIQGLDKEKYLELCKFFEEEANFTCTAPKDWEIEYIKHMQRKQMEQGGGDPNHKIKPTGKKRLF